jgi:predicted dehydrogenase
MGNRQANPWLTEAGESSMLSEQVQKAQMKTLPKLIPQYPRRGIPMTTTKAEVCLIGCGSMARYHIQMMMQKNATTHIAAICEPSPEMYDLAAKIFIDNGLEPPPNQPDLEKLLSDYRLDAAFIISPHAFHHDQTIACMQAGLDVLLEKPMVMNAREAYNLIEARDRTGRLLVVAFPGSLSPQIRTAVNMLRSGEAGKLLSISATVWQNWGLITANTWRQQPLISGGGFLFDTGAHMLNTVMDLTGEEFIEVAAWLNECSRPVETMGVIIGRLESGVIVTLHACGETIPSCASDIRVFGTRAILRTGVWGERLEIQRLGRKRLYPVRVPPSLGVWEQFLAIRAQNIPNPCPPEVGLRMVRLYDAVKASAAQNGAPVKCI